MDLVVKGRALVDGAVRSVAIGVERGRIVRVASDLRAPRTLDFGERLVLPGAVDAHVHFRDPGHPEKEDFGSGTLSALHGGVTAVLDMPNTDPPTTTVEALLAKKEIAARKAVVDFGLFAGNSPDLADALVAQATAVKTYMGASTGNLLVRDGAQQARAIALAAARGKVAAFHAEDQLCLEHHAQAERGASDVEAHSRARPPECEAESVRALASLSRPPGARVHVCHLSSAAGLAEVERAGNLSAEVTPHHLLLAMGRTQAEGARLKMNPPLRAESDREALWRAFAGGRIPLLASDHAPHTAAEKARGVWDAPSGVPGVETMVPLLLAEVAAGRLDLATLISAACEAPARLYGLPKGRIAPGYDADFAVYDLARAEPVRASRLHSRCGWTPYEGLSAVFPTDVLLRGEVALADGKAVDGGPRGRFLPGTFKA